MSSKDDGAGDDLYDDIPLTTAVASSSATTTMEPKKAPPPTTTWSSTSKNNGKKHHHPKSLTDQVLELQERVQRLEQENATLKRNMGTLFRTATAELARKDRQLQEQARQQQLTTDSAPDGNSDHHHHHHDG